MAATLGPSPLFFSGHSCPRRSLFLNLKPPCFSSPGGPDSLPSTQDSPQPGPSPSPPASVDPVKLAFERAKAYKTNPRPPPPVDSVAPDTASASTLDAGASKEVIPGLREGNGVGLGESIPGKDTGKERLVISNVGFLGLDFADKKQTRGLPPGLVPISDPFPEGETPDVEIIVGDASQFDNSKASKQAPSAQEGDPDFYKPKVTSWGVFPRPSNISKTFGGGRVIHPGEVLETTEDRAAKEARTRELLAAYKKKMGLSIDAQLKSECENALKDGDSLMDVGKLKEALSYYQQIMDKLPFQSELYGLAALQWSICQDSLARPSEARIMYEKLQSHPNARITKKARQFMFSFEAMEMMKVRSSRISSAESTGYRDYFEAFVEEKSAYGLNNKIDLEEGSATQVLPYVIFLLAPIFAVLIIALYK
ncbi:hypothetical protein MLD38_011032 [Melastoma candidum]|uniref:Uncharacterized protein n=1 Tax=Melastoma candidum TaxID=119954 RepID=A0ACB9R2X2_9MYRT|nr:hypothetical protein MLD38_011032 [Melastoma candidum]